MYEPSQHLTVTNEGSFLVHNSEFLENFIKNYRYSISECILMWSSAEWVQMKDQTCQIECKEILNLNNQL